MATPHAHEPRFSEERRCPRIGAQMLAVVHDHEARRYCQVRDLSEGGMRLLGEDVPPEMTYLDVDVHLPDKLAPMRVVARRVHRRTGGWGLRFVKLPPGGASRLSRFVRAQLSQNRLPDRRAELSARLEESTSLEPPNARNAPAPAPPIDPFARTGLQLGAPTDVTDADVVCAAVVPAAPPRPPPLPAPPRPRLSEPSAGRSRPALPVPQDAVAPSSSIARPAPVGAYAPAVRVATPLSGRPPSPAPSVRSTLFASAVRPAQAAPPRSAPAPAAAPARAAPSPTPRVMPAAVPQKSDSGSGPRLHAQEIAARRVIRS